MTANFTGGGSGGPDYVQDTAPADADVGEIWWDPSADPDGDGTTEGERYVYGDDGQWHATGVKSHLALADVAEDNHHAYPIRTSGLLDDAVIGAKVAADAIDTPHIAASAITNALVAADAIDSNEIAANAITNALIAADAVDSAQVAASAIDQAHLSFDTATQSELNSHAGDTSNPHNVTDDQTGAASALSNHASNSTAHHSKPTGTTTDGVGRIIEQTPYIDYNNSAGVDQPGQSLDGDTGTYADTSQSGEWIEYWPAQGPEMVHGVDIEIYSSSNSIPLELRDSMGNVLETKTAQPQTGFDSIRFSTVGRSVRAAATDRTLIEEFRLLQTFAAPHSHGVTQ